MTLLCLLVNIVACSLLYLSHKNQQILPQKLPSVWQKLALALLLINAVLWWQNFSATSGLLLWLTSTMLNLSLLPFAALLLKRRRV